MPVPECKLAGESGNILPREILRLRSSKIAVNVYLSNLFIFALFKECNQVPGKGALSPSFSKVGGTCPVSPGFYVYE